MEPLNSSGYFNDIAWVKKFLIVKSAKFNSKIKYIPVSDNSFMMSALFSGRRKESNLDQIQIAGKGQPSLLYKVTTV